MSAPRKNALLIATLGIITTLVITLAMPTGYGPALTGLFLLAVSIGTGSVALAWHMWDHGFNQPSPRHPARRTSTTRAHRPSVRV